MEQDYPKNLSVHISSRSRLNLTFNLYQCGNSDIVHEGTLEIMSTGAFTLMYMNEGTGLLEAEDIAFRIQAGQGLFAFPDTRYLLRNMGEPAINVTWLIFAGYSIEPYLNRANISSAKPVFSDPDGRFGKMVLQIYLTSQKMPNRYCKMMSTLYALFAGLLDANPTLNPEGYIDNSDYFAVRVVNYIERNYARNISVNDIANNVGVSRKQLYAVFERTLKISPKQYLISYRIEKACTRLKHSPQSVQEIAESVGYANQFYFAKEFKRLVGMTPTEYRKSSAVSEIFSYRTYVPELMEKYKGYSVDLPLDEQVLTVLSPAQMQRLQQPREDDDSQEKKEDEP